MIIDFKEYYVYLGGSDNLNLINSFFRQFLIDRSKEIINKFQYRVFKDEL